MFIEDIDSEFSESIRTLRTLMVAKFQRKNLILLSSTYRRRKNYNFSLNTALAFSKIGKVILIETDIRRPTVLNVTIKKICKKSGFSDIIQGRS